MNAKTLNNKSVAITQQHNNQTKNRFQTLWDKAEALKHDNLALQTSLDQLVQRVQTDIRPVELDMGRAMRLQIDKLIMFAGRRSLAQWQSYVLDDWIRSSLDVLESLGLVDDALRNNLAKLQAQVFGVEIDPDSDLSAAEQLSIAMDEQLNGIDIRLDDDSASADIDDVEETMRWSDDDAEQAEFWAEMNEQFEWHHHPNHGKTVDNSASAAQPETVFKTLFHRVARALHPDKEVDAQKREAKQALMAQLLKARRDKDLMQVFELYQEHVADTQAFSEQALKELETVLHDFIGLEVQRRLEITTQSYLHEAVFHDFYHVDSVKVDRAVSRKIKQVEKRRKDIEAFTQNVTSLKKLRPYLEARYDEHDRLSRYL